MKNAQILLVGNSHGHIYQVLEHFQPATIHLFSSESLKNALSPLIKELQSKNIDLTLHWINPFKENALFEIITKITEVGEKHILSNPDEKLYIGLTGGTNLMAIGAGIASTILSCDSHYLVKNSEEIFIYRIKDALEKHLFQQNL